MSKNKGDTNFLDLLREDDKEKIKNYVIENGKEPKVICPIMFEKGDNKNESE